MCGIVGAVGKLNIRDYLIKGLSTLEYRGYDSSGIAFSTGSNVIKTYKSVGKVAELDAITPECTDASIGIGHTRWATHGAPSLSNCHPHFSMNEVFALVHNGVIENYRALKTGLQKRGYHFRSDTDSEVIANLLEYHYQQTSDVLVSIHQTMKMIEGSFAIALLSKFENERIYFMKRSSPLIIGVGDEAYFIASDAVPIISYTKKFVDLDDDQYGFIEKNDLHLYCNNKRISYEFSNKNPELLSSELGDYPNYMLKEIEETPDVISRIVDNYYDGEHFLFNSHMIEAIKNADEIVFIACGTSYHASLEGRKYMHYLGKRSSVYIASEWAYNPFIAAKNPLFILITQSGETADLIKCQKIINKRGLVNIAITNTKGSTIEREATFSCLLYAGLEVAVASTKAFSAQVAVLALIVGAYENKSNVVNHLYALNDALKNIISRRSEIESISANIEDANIMFFIGRGSDYHVALESSLKMKEISYIHSEAFPGGELKHGPIAIVDKNTRLIAFTSDMATDLALRNNVKEVETRNAKCFIISSEPLFKDGDSFSVPFVKNYLAIIPMVFVGQYLAYYVALHKGLNIDKPRNLAKSVTVE